MKHTYKIEGMTCNGCRSSVQNKLQNIEGVTNVDVSLEAKEAVVTMDRHINTAVFRAALPEKYTLEEKQKPTPKPVVASADMNTEPSKWQQLFPLFLILLYISTASILLNINPWQPSELMYDFMGLFFIVFSFFKMLDLKGFPDSFRMYDPIAKRALWYAKLYPFIETALGLMFLLRFQIPVALIVTIIILSITTVGVAKTLLDKRAIKCACLGTALQLPMTEATLIENSIMLIMAISMIIQIAF